MNFNEGSPNGSSTGDATPRQTPDWLSEPTLREGTKILLPVDFSEAAIEALWYAKRLAQAFHTRLALLHVVEPAEYAPMYCTPDELFRLKSHAKESAEAKLRKLANSSTREGDRFTGHVEIIVGEGNAAEQILRTAWSISADLIVIPAHGRTGAKHLLPGNTAEKVVRNAPCPVLLVREKVTAVTLAPPPFEDFSDVDVASLLRDLVKKP
jgi:nucleotide-binding universal stress UspA family protein